MVSLCTNLGDTKTLLTHPASTSHGKLSEDQRQAAGIGQGLIRVAVGLDHINDITADLARGQALFQASCTACHAIGQAGTGFGPSPAALT